MTFPPNILEAVRTVITHADCPDGVASAIFLHDALPRAEVRFLRPGSKELAELPATPGMLFCDISPPEARVQEFVDVGAIVLDHHKTARKVVEAFGERGIFGDEVTMPGVCGAVLAFAHVWSPTVAPMTHIHERARQFARLAGVRDTWQRQHRDFRRALVQGAMLLFYPPESWLAIEEPFEKSDLWNERMEVGEVVFAGRERDVANAVKRSFRETVPRSGTRIVIFEGSHLTSEAAELIDVDADVVVGFGFVAEANEPRMRVSMRSHTTFDCALMARTFGGGGHTKAAGFDLPLTPASPNPYAIIRGLIDAHERSQ